jgi:drug/metabolite transporter (DMT)-like permease
MAAGSASRLAGRLGRGWSGLGGNTRGALLMTVNALVFSIMVALIKISAETVPLALVMFFSVATQFFFVSVSSMRRFGRSLVTAERRGLHLLRVALLVAGLYAGFSAVVLLPLAEATAISFSKAFFVTLFAAFLLGEVVGGRRWLAVVVGFAGILILARPGNGDISVIGAAMGLLSAAAAAGGAIATRILAQRDTPAQLLLYQAAFGTLMLAPVAVWDWQTPDLATAAFLVLIGVLSVIGNTAMIMALRVGEASALAPIDFTRAVFAAAIGALFLGEIPTLWAIVGTSVVIAGALLSIRRETRKPRPVEEACDEL